MADDCRCCDPCREHNSCEPECADPCCETGGSNWLLILVLIFVFCGGFSGLGGLGGLGGGGDCCSGANQGGGNWLLIIVVLYLLWQCQNDGKGGILDGLFC